MQSLPKFWDSNILRQEILSLLLHNIVIVSGVAGRPPKNICLRCDLQFQYPAQPDTEKLEIDLRQIFFGGRPATPDTSIPQLYNQAITRGTQSN